MPDGDRIVINPELLLKASKERRAWVETAYRLASGFSSVFVAQEFAERVVRLIVTQLRRSRR